MKTTKTSKQTIANLKARMATVVQDACKALGVEAAHISIGARCSATLATERDANELVAALRLAGAKDVDMTHWDPKVDTDFDADEYQVCWS